MKENLIKTSNVVIDAGILLAVFFVPLVFFPFVSDLGTFEFSKQMVLYLLVGVMLFFWVLRMLLEGNVEIKRTVVDPFILLFLLVYLLATFFSLDRWTSVFGDHPRLHGGLISMVIYVLFYFIIVSHITEKKQLVRILGAMMASAVLLSVVGMVRFFRLDVGFVDFSESIWALIGSGEKAAMWLSMLFPVLVGLILYVKDNSYKLVLTACGVLLLGYLGLLNYYPAMVAALLAVVGFMVFIKPRIIASHAIHILILGVVFVIVAAFSNVPFLKQSVPYFQDLTPPRELSLNHQTSWVTVLGGFNLPKNVFLGSGPATYLYDFSRFRPLGLNNTPFWNLKFSRASNEVFQMISTVGILGFLAFLMVFIWSLRRTARELFRKGAGEETLIILGLGMGIVSGLILFLFTTSTTATMFTLWLLLALIFSSFGLWRKSNLIRSVRLSFAAIPVTLGLVSQKVKKRDALSWVVFTSVGVLLLIFFLFEGKYFLADISYKKSIQATTIGDAVFHSSRAVNLFPQNATYRIQRANISLSSAVSFITGKQDLTQDEQQDLLTLLVIARDEANAAVSLAPFNGTSWETRGNVFLTLAARFNVEGAEDEALDSFTRASQLSSTVPIDPFNPRYPNLRGLIQLRFKNNIDLAEQNFFIALNLKPDYATASYNLAQVSRERGNNAQAQALIDQLLARYNTLDIIQISDLGVTKEQLQKERDALIAPLEPAAPDESGREEEE